MAHDTKNIFNIFREEEERLIAASAAERDAEEAAWAAMTPEERNAILASYEDKWGHIDDISDQDADLDEDLDDDECDDEED